MNTTTYNDKRKREEIEDIKEYGEEDNKLFRNNKINNFGQNLNNNTSFLINIPEELLNLILNNLDRKDLINLSCINKEHRLLFYCDIFKNIQIKWQDINYFLNNFKLLNLIERIKILSNLNNLKETNKSEWNISFKKLFENCKNLKDMQIELLTSGRCLKYKDDFDIELTNKINKMTLVSKIKENNEGFINDNAMFELTQLQRFHKIKQLTLKNFCIGKDIYFYPKIKEDLSDFNKRCNDGKLVELQDIKLINCTWEYPINLKEVFSPEYPINNSNNNNNLINNRKNCKPKKIGLYYSGNFIKFLNCERFKNFINTDYNDKFLFEIDFYDELKELEIILMNDKFKETEFSNFYPNIDIINLRREYYIKGFETNEVIKKNLISNLERLILVGWKCSTIQELDKCFKINNTKQYNMKHIEIYLMRGNNFTYCYNNPIDYKDLENLKNFHNKLKDIFGDDCYIKVGYIDECMDGRYNDLFEESFAM